MSNLPAWASEALAEAGMDESGWTFPDSERQGYLHTAGHQIEVVRTANSSDCALFVNKQWIRFDLSPDIAFVLASRLSAALEGRADPRVQELEAKLANHEIYVAMNQEETIKQLEAEVKGLRLALRNCRAAAWREARRPVLLQGSHGIFRNIVKFCDDAIGKPSLLRAKAALSLPEPKEPAGGEDGS